MGTTHARLERVGLFCCTAMDLTPQLGLSPIQRGAPITYALSWLIRKWVWLLRFFRQFTKDHVRFDTSQCSESCTGTTGKARMISLQPLQADRFHRIR